MSSGAKCLATFMRYLVFEVFQDTWHSNKEAPSAPKGPFRTKNATMIAKIVNYYAVVFLLRPPDLLRRGPFSERENVCNSQENGVRAEISQAMCWSGGAPSPKVLQKTAWGVLFVGRREKTPTPKTRFSIWTLLRTPGRFTTMGSQHPSPNVKNPLQIEPQIARSYHIT